MFSGIIHHIGQIVSIEGARLVLKTDIKAELGDSIAVSGVCLTVVEIDGDNLSFDLASETLRKTKLGTLKAADRVNLEGSLEVGDKIHGHFVQGHVDAVAQLVSKKEENNTIRFEFSLPAEIKAFVAPKGSICIDGISLTVGEVEAESFSVYIIPFTLEETTFSNLEIEDSVNLEVDCLARYVGQILANE